MVENIYIKNRDSIRRHYLIALGINWVTWMADIIYPAYREFPNTSVIELLMGSLLLFCMTGLVQYIPYHCAYKKNDTKLLMLHMIFGPLICLSSYYQFMKNSQSSYQAIIYLIVMLPYFICAVYWFISTYRMYKLNSSISTKSLYANKKTANYRD